MRSSDKFTVCHLSQILSRATQPKTMLKTELGKYLIDASYYYKLLTSSSLISDNTKSFLLISQSSPKMGFGHFLLVEILFSLYLYLYSNSKQIDAL